MKKQTLVLAFCSLIVGVNAQLPNHHWSKSADGGALAKGYCITSDNSGNVYTAGIFSGTNDFDPSAATSNLTSFGSDDIFIVKTTYNGDFVWAKNIGGSQAEIPNAITFDLSGNIYLTGEFSGTADFNTEAGTANLASAGGTDAFVVKLNANGQLVWAKNVGGASNDSGEGIDIDDFNGNVYITGWFTGTSDFDPGSGIANQASNGSTDIFMLKLDSNGDYLTSKTFGGVAADAGASIVVDAATGDQFLTGNFSGTTDFDPGAGVVDLTGSNDIFVLKLNVLNDFVFVKQMGGIAVDEGRTIGIDANGFIYVHGSFISTCNFNTSGGTTNVTSNGSDDVFVVQLSPAGDLNWVRTFGSTGTEDFMDMSVNSFGDIYLTGEMAGDMDANPDLVIVNTLVKQGAEDAYMIALGSDGGYYWATSYGVLDPAMYTRGFGIYADESNNVYCTGSFYSTIDFDPTIGVNDLVAVNGADIWYQKLGPGTNGLNEINPIANVSIYPNPSNGNFTLNSGTLIADAVITITDLSGKQLQKWIKKDFSDFQINIENSCAGVYFVEIKSSGYSEVIKVIKN